MVTQYQFEQLITRLEEAIKFYKTTPYRYNENRLYLSNGKILDFMFQKHYIPHLLGINIGNLKTSKVLLSDKPLEMTEELIQRYTAIYQKMQRGELKYDDIFSPYIEKKLTVFTNVLKLNFSDIVCACHHVPGRAYVAGKMEGYGCEYYIMLDDGKKSPYFLGLKKEKGITDYCPSSILYDLSSDSQIPKMLTNQQIMLVNCLEYLNSGKTEIFNLSEKLEMVRTVKKIATQYDSHFIVDSELEFNLRKIMEVSNKNNESEKFLSKLTTAIVKGKQMKKSCNMGNQYQELVDAYNASLLANSSGNSNLEFQLSELKKLRKELSQARTTIQNQQQTITLQQQTIASQQQHLKEQDQQLQTLTQFKEETCQLVKKYTNNQDK